MRWPPYKHVFFDCDSTLSTVEGIDVLAETVGKKWRVEVLTNAAMDGKLDLEEVYAKRLQAVRPTHEQIQQIRSVYKRNIVTDAQAVIAALQFLGHQVYIISGGLAEPVQEFGVFLGVPKQNIRAVNVDYDHLSGDWWYAETDFQKPIRKRYIDYEEGALTVSDGKAQIVKELLGRQNGRSLLIGDGSSDLLASHTVDLFVGFGGVVQRDRVKAESPIFLHTPSLAPLLLLAAGPAAIRQVKGTSHEAVFNKAFELTNSGAFDFNHERLKQKFQDAYQTVHTGAD
ncbi:HAD-IB family phosphatase [Candidatus Leptofilum sp.]|uniref:HAD-IB family phosphatase n=1 Tax=Candidatus Leptofilum sp. TaxID=3241576 RepID=UPI003B5C7240